MSSKWKKVKSFLVARACSAAASGDPPQLLLPGADLHSLDSSLVRTDASFVSEQVVAASTTKLKHSHSTSLSPRNICSICLEPIKAGGGHALFTAECSHTFHFFCIASNVSYGNLVCPVCRAIWKEVPWQAPIGADRSRKHTRTVSLRGMGQHGSIDNADAVESERRRLDPVLRILDENIASARGHWQTYPVEPSVYNDDDPLERGIIQGARERGGPSTENVNNVQSEPRAIRIKTSPEVSAVKASKMVEKFTVLVNLKAPPMEIMEQMGHREGDSDQTSVSRVLCAPVDLVTVLDVSGSMAGSKLALLKRAMGFVIRSLSSTDRLSIVAFSSRARRILPLQRMGEEGQEEAVRVVDALAAGGGTNISEGLSKARKVLEDRRERNPISAVMLLSDGQDTYTSSRRRLVPMASNLLLIPSSIRRGLSHDSPTQTPVYTFGFGADHDAATMHSIAEGSGGTFSFIQAEGTVQDAFAQCIAGLLSVVVQDVEMMISCTSPGVEIKAIRAGSYESSILDSAKHGLVKLGDLYAEEQRDVLVELKLPSISQHDDGSNEVSSILEVSCRFKDPVTQGILDCSPSHELNIPRPRSISKEQGQISLQVDQQKNRLLAADAITEARTMADQGDIASAQHIVQTARAKLGNSPSVYAGDPVSIMLAAELGEIQARMTNSEVYQQSGRAYLLSAQSSHLRQRATTRGESIDGHSRDYQTPIMADMVLLSQTFSSSIPYSDSQRPASRGSLGFVARATHSLLRRPSRRMQN